MDRGTAEEQHVAQEAWRKYELLTSSLSQELCEQLRLVLEPSLATKLKYVKYSQSLLLFLVVVSICLHFFSQDLYVCQSDTRLLPTRLCSSDGIATHRYRIGHGLQSFNPFTPRAILEAINVVVLLSLWMKPKCMTIQIKAIEQFFQVALFIFDNFAKRNSRFFPSVLNLDCSLLNCFTSVKIS